MQSAEVGPPACPGCGADVAGRCDRAYCSNACRQAAYRERLRQAEVERAGIAAFARFLTHRELEDFLALVEKHSRNAPTYRSRNEVGP